MPSSVLAQGVDKELDTPYVPTPQQVVDRISQEALRAIESPDLRERWRAMGSEPPAVRTPAEFTAFVERERRLYAELVKRSGATAD